VSSVYIYIYIYILLLYFSRSHSFLADLPASLNAIFQVLTAVLLKFPRMSVKMCRWVNVYKWSYCHHHQGQALQENWLDCFTRKVKEDISNLPKLWYYFTHRRRRRLDLRRSCSNHFRPCTSRCAVFAVSVTLEHELKPQLRDLNDGTSYITA